MSIKVCLINPPHPYLTNPNAQAPLGLLYIAAMLQDRNVDVVFTDLSDKCCDGDFELCDADLYGITATILDVKTCHLLAKKIKNKNRNAKVLLGGPITLSPTYIDSSLIDSILCGEGEYEIFNVIKDYPNIKSIYSAKRILNLDRLPYPARYLLNSMGSGIFANRYEYYQGGSVVISTARGCPFSCIFCASPRMWKRKVVVRNVECVKDEIIHVVNNFNVRQFRFSDENLTWNKNVLYELCDCLKDMDIAWRASVRVKPNDIEMFKKMKQAGCVEVCFGIESGDPDVLRVLRKGSLIKDNRQAIINAKDAGLNVRILFMIGTPGESKYTVQRNIQFLEGVYKFYDTIAIANFTPLPGTEVAEYPELFKIRVMNTSIDDFNLCLWGPDSLRQWKNHILPYDMTDEEMTNNKNRMLDYVLSTGKVNRG